MGIVAALVALALSVAGCGGDDETTGRTAPEQTSPSVNPQPEPAPEPKPKPKPKPAPEPEPTEERTGGNSMQDAAYNESKELCSLFSAQQLASEYGGNPADLSSVVRAYAESSYQPGAQISAETGCLAGLTG